ncbi:hypothetical protein BDZ89DRAFT_1111773 [Hymenopellis radicata]|nr:hypothetical protein BDZ89DRAFT_1111773 [Hymenopellis radicata]
MIPTEPPHHSSSCLAPHTSTQSTMSNYPATSANGPLTWRVAADGYPSCDSSLPTYFEDELVDEGGPPRFLQELETKRRQNRLAAQRSRQRKKDYVKHLEDEVSELKQQVARWKATVEIYEGMLLAHGLSLSVAAMHSTKPRTAYRIPASWSFLSQLVRRASLYFVMCTL